MSNRINNEKGNIGIALVIVIVAIMSGISLASVAFRDSHSFRQQLDGIQEFHFLRSEVGRGRLVASHLETFEVPPQVSVLPLRLMRVNFDDHRTVYRAQTKMEYFEGEFDKGFLIRSLLSAVRGTEDTNVDNLQSVVRRYGENRIRSLQTLAIFHYFSDKDLAVDDVPGNIRFYSGDEVWGRVHSNTDIYILSNNWPKFHDLVSTAGKIRVHPGGGTNYPRDQIFLGGLIEDYRKIAFESNADLVRRYGRQLGTPSDDERIAFVTVEGSSYEGMIGEIVKDEGPPWIEGYNQFTVYDSYPPYGPVGDSIAVNLITVRDTLWNPFPGGGLANQSMFVNMELWISGNFGGRQTWASSHDIYLKGDMLYQRTQPGQPPDGTDDNGNVIYPVNSSDYLGIISEKNIYIQYGYKDPYPDAQSRHKPNTSDIYLYGAYCAVGQGEDTWDDGVFTYEYQFPKGSTPPQYWLGERFTNIDLYRFHYPTTSLDPWPLGLDYPWYNPLWPEPGQIYGFSGFPETPNPHGAPTIVKLRGNINLFGSIAQRRRGYVRRSGNADFDTGLWDIYNEISPTTPPQYGAPNPGINATGYDKVYKYDRRFDRISPPHFPLVKFEGYDTDDLMDLGHLTETWLFKKPPSNF